MRDGGMVMPKLKPETQTARRDNILNAALDCFARAGFHRTTMQDICKLARVSPGALYVYFDSKEALIAGLCERDRAEFAERFAELEQAHDFFAALAAIGQYYFVEESPEKRLFVVEMGVESTRNDRVAEIYRSVDRYCQDRFAALFTRLQTEGRIAPQVDIATLTSVFNIIGEGLFWRRAVHPDFDAAKVLPTVTLLLQMLMNPTGNSASDPTTCNTTFATASPRAENLKPQVSS
jgi:AcrR family transcriptional regulator